MSINARLMIYFFMVSAVPLLISGALAFTSAQGEINRQLENQLESVAARQAAGVTAALDGQSRLVATAAASPGLGAAMRALAESGDEADVDAVEARLAVLKQAVGAIERLDALDNRGVVIASTAPGARGQMFSSFISQDGAARSSVEVSTEFSQVSLVGAAPVTEHGLVTGWLRMLASAGPLTAVANDGQGLGRSGQTWVVFAAGDNVVVWARSAAPNSAGQTLDPSDERPVYEAAIAGVPSVSRSAGPVDGVTVVLAAHPLASGDAVVVVTMDRDEAVLPAARLAANLVAAGAVSLTMVAAFSMYLSGSISRPLRDLAHVSDRIRGGDSSIRVAVTGDDDLARLSKNVNALADALIAANRDLEQRVKDRTEALERSNQDLEQFAYVSSHDLQEPLRSVAGFVELLERRLADKMGDDDRKFVGYIVDATKRMQTLINDLLTYSRVNRRPAEPTEVDLAELVGGIRRSLDAAVRRTGADIRVGPMPAILADRLQMEQLFQNIIANGIKFHGEAPPIVDVSSHRADDRWVFEVRDNGIGMEPRHLEKIFVIFQRLHGRAEYEGTGIGLAICKKIVEAHGGTIAVESEPGKGTTFRFSITGGDTGPQEPQHLVYRPVQPGFAERGSELV